ncbi:hypothetical protein CJD36_020105 [Flavipsychrobacter stenotrophus]|uniref:DUF3830 domain-containing protein n=1 Tax=Flavipsychrobacter stenotrophus TaxID=2077091 RepID=A0A2S7SRK1_9BACT|nr:DUF3830 family protein [Flavipsychrobacter stenotrophus]PQJ09543.1 hypothetical protein CJD36_020105 [Flavipsychrobacter stenotrophus]
MNGFKLTTATGLSIRFEYYTDAAPVTCAAFASLLPFTRTFYHARVSGQEIWIDNVPPLNIIQENASVFTIPGEVVFGPSKPVRVKTTNCMGIYYGEGKGLDACNIFAKVIDEDAAKLTVLGDDIWQNGKQDITIEAL